MLHYISIELTQHVLWCVNRACMVLWFISNNNCKAYLKNSGIPVCNICVIEQWNYTASVGRHFENFPYLHITPHVKYNGESILTLSEDL